MRRCLKYVETRIEKQGGDYEVWLAVEEISKSASIHETLPGAYPFYIMTKADLWARMSTMRYVRESMLAMDIP